ncbi:hypothetical protein ACIGXI_39270 [Kitasatospora aureofaciens]|uniref:hypothetical protein n=1 Tax=Kitasatospora aureofaciens TaxID=1894 RepID=UPI0037CB6299
MTTPTTQPPKVSWYAQWECGACGDGGDALFEDGTLVDADHDCDEGDGDEIGWDGRAECGACGWALETQFADGDYVEADHDCPNDQ